MIRANDVKRSSKFNTRKRPGRHVVTVYNKSMASGSDNYYFDSYAGFDIHEVMLKDSSRTLAYRNSIYKNPTLFDSKVVLDVGCGTGILSLFAASAGARKVYAVEKSGIAKYAEQIVAKNGFADRIQLLNTAAEDISLPEQVDVIVSEWMGYCLLYESMLPSVIAARDKYMRPGGTMWPNRARMFITGLEDKTFAKRKFGFWDDICGFKLTATKRCALCEPLVETAPESGIVTDDSQLVEYDLNTVTASDLNLDAEFSLTPLESVELTALIVWFDVSFDGPEERIVLSTSPFEKETHWAQTIFYLPEPVQLESDLPLKGTFSIKPNQRNHRDQDIVISFTYKGQERRYGYKMR